MPVNPICVAIDTNDRSEVERLIDATHGDVGMFKFGLTALYGVGFGELREVDRRGRPLFVDAKLHDIPAQIDGAIDGLRRLNPDFVTVHASGGYEMVGAAVKATQGEFSILGVTVLTSLDDDLLASIGMTGPVTDAVLRLADVALQAGVDGLVCSAEEVSAVKDRFGSRSEGGPILVVPGIRPSSGSSDDQRRTMTPKEALSRGADVLVVGRPITGADDPGAAARAMRAEVSA